MSIARPVWRLLRALALSLLLILMLPVALIAVLATETGTGWLLNRVDELARPLGVELSIERSRGSLFRHLQLDGLVFEGLGTRLELGHLRLQWRPRDLLARRLHIESLELADIRVLPPPPVESEATALEIPDLVLPIEMQLDRLLLERLDVVQGDGNIVVRRVALRAGFDAQGLEVRDLQFDGQGAQLEGWLGMQAKAPHLLAGDISARIDQALSGEEIGAVVVGLVLSGPALEPVFDLEASEPAILRMHGELQLDQAQPGFEIAANWPKLPWPLRGGATVTSEGGHLTLEGIATDYRLELHSKVTGEGIPPSSVDLLAEGDLQGIRLQPLKVTTLDGLLQADGSVHWGDAVRWDFKLRADGLDPGGFEPQLPGRISGRIDVSGGLGKAPSEGLELHLLIQELTGRLREYKVGASGELDYRGGELRAKSLEVTSGPNRIYVDGRADKRLDLRFEIKAPELASLYPGLSGQLAGAGRLEGTPEVPIVVAKINGQAVAYQGARTKDLSIDLDWRESGGTGRLRLTGLDSGGLQISELSADLDGSPESHRLQLDAQATEFSAGFTAQGGLQEQVWSGTLQSLSLQESGLGTWKLRAPGKLRLGQTEARAGLLCLTQADTRVCAEGGWDETAGLDFSASLADLDLAMLAPHIPGEAVIEGGLGADFRVIGDLASPKVTFELRPSDGLIRVEQDLQPLELAYRNARVSGRFEKDAGSADLNFELGPQGRAQGRVQLGADKDGQRSIGGKLDVDFPDLSLVAGFVPSLAQVEGRLHLVTTLGGTLAEPRVQGALEITEASAQILDAGIALTDIELSVRGDGHAPLRVRGQINSGEGLLAIAGDVDVSGPLGPSVDLTLTGENFLAVQLPEATVRIAPDLRLQGEGPYRLSGTLLIPTAAIELNEVPSGTIDVSSDEIVIGEEEIQVRAAETQNLTARVRVELGKDVTFKGFGLKTSLDGALDAAVDKQGTRVDGRIELRDGRYKAYGQDLKIERGRLLFVGPPGNPGVDLRAMRESRDGRVRAYLAMSGPLSKPRPRIYSEPSLPEAEALAYLLTGRGLDDASQKEGVNITGAALSLGLSTAEPLFQQMSDRLGLDEIRVDEGDGGVEDTSVILGKYLNPDLYVGYSQGLFNPEGAVLLRLRLGKQLEVESRSGNEQSVDLYYRLEHD